MSLNVSSLAISSDCSFKRVASYTDLFLLLIMTWLVDCMEWMLPQVEFESATEVLSTWRRTTRLLVWFEFDDMESSSLLLYKSSMFISEGRLCKL